MLRTALSRLMPLAMFAVVVLVLVGAALAGNLPLGVQRATSEMAQSVGVEVPMPTVAPSAFHIDEPELPSVPRAVEVHDAIDAYRSDLTDWNACFHEDAVRPLRGDDLGKADGDQQVGQDRDCGERPRLDIPPAAGDGVASAHDQDRSDASTSKEKDDDDNDRKDGDKGKDNGKDREKDD